MAANQKRVNHFHRPIRGSEDWNTYDNMERQMQIGFETYPQYPVSGLSEAFFRLREVLGTA